MEDTLRGIAAEHDGYFTSGEADEAGIKRAIVVQLKHRGRLERVDRGLYRLVHWPQNDLQDYHRAILWPTVHRDLDYAVISHDSALQLYGLSDLNPASVHITVPAGFRARRPTPAWLRIHSEDVPERDRTSERGVPTISIVRAIEQIAPTRGLGIVHQAISEARERNLLRDDELQPLVEQFGAGILEPYHA
ncbi:MAG TPA: type IV toxin-antitoxin system AbiEi family antitoxin domain-containing protein [Candidatus Elarobacter sp.]|nr:type IV toxin-antitoxin system AbiEi family antitoxin domain-containing protein [Candidatus Elarobacter sp.]